MAETSSSSSAATRRNKPARQVELTCDCTYSECPNITESVSTIEELKSYATIVSIRKENAKNVKSLLYLSCEKAVQLRSPTCIGSRLGLAKWHFPDFCFDPMSSVTTTCEQPPDNDLTRKYHISTWTVDGFSVRRNDSSHEYISASAGAKIKRIRFSPYLTDRRYRIRQCSSETMFDNI